MSNAHFHRYRCFSSGTKHKGLKTAGMVIGGVFLAALFALAFSFVVQALWNWLIPDVFGAADMTITFWEAFGLILLAKLLFGGFGSHHGHDHDGPPWGCKDKEWKHYDRFWEDEGKDAFDKYVERVESGEDAEA